METRCRFCRSWITFVQTIDRHGQPRVRPDGTPVTIPLNPEPDSAGTVMQTRGYARVLRQSQLEPARRAGVQLYVPHFATCTARARVPA